MKAHPDNTEMIGLCHIGIHASNPASLAAFYREYAKASDEPKFLGRFVLLPTGRSSR
jgi:hypothetical protein